MKQKKDKKTTDKDIQQSIEEADVLRRILKGQPLTLEAVSIWEKWTDVVTKEKKRKFIGHEYRYVQNGVTVEHGIGEALIARHLVSPVTDEDETIQTFALTPAGELVAAYEQQTFALEIPQAVVYA